MAVCTQRVSLLALSFLVLETGRFAHLLLVKFCRCVIGMTFLAVSNILPVAHVRHETGWHCMGLDVYQVVLITCARQCTFKSAWHSEQENLVNPCHLHFAISGTRLEIATVRTQKASPTGKVLQRKIHSFQTLLHTAKNTGASLAVHSDKKGPLLKTREQRGCNALSNWEVQYY